MDIEYGIWTRYAMSRIWARYAVSRIWACVGSI